MNIVCTILLTSLCFSAFATEYLHWDNVSPASELDLLQDPLLILRTADRRSSSEQALPLACKRASLCNFFDTADSHIPAIGESNHPSLPTVAGGLSVSADTCFDHTKPTFFCTTADEWDYIHWQVSDRADFTAVISTLDAIDPLSPAVCLSDLAETFLSSGPTYFFRARGLSTSCCSEWSEPVAFTVKKPAAPRGLHIAGATLSWAGCQDDRITYLVFGSNSIDFVPSIYTRYQIDAMLGGSITAASEADNFLGETVQPFWQTDTGYAYYRVLAQARGHVSSPSALACNYSAVHASRDALHTENPEHPHALACRTPFPVSAKYARNPQVHEDVWDLLQDYLLPETHPAKAALDKIFSKYDVLSSKKTFKKAGFELLKHPQNRMIIAKHPKLKGYLVKAFLDAEPNTEWEWWKKRIDGARTIQAGIDKHGYHALMKVPKKWIYPLPANEASSTEPKKQFVLIVENMNLQESGEIRKSFKTKVTRELLDALYVIITENLLIDSIFADNIPFSKDGRIAFVDTEHFNDTTQPIRLWMIARYLSPEMHAYWDQVLFHGRPLTL